MKLWKLNAILIILSLSLCSCAENTAEAARKIRRDIYEENDRYLNTLENVEQIPLKKIESNKIQRLEKIESIENSQTFLENKKNVEEVPLKKVDPKNESNSKIPTEIFIETSNKNVDLKIPLKKSDDKNIENSKVENIVSFLETNKKHKPINLPLDNNLEKFDQNTKKDTITETFLEIQKSEKSPKPKAKNEKKTTKINKKATKIVKNKPKSGLKLIKLQNAKLFKDPKDISFERCRKKTGYLYIVKSNLNPFELRVSPIFAYLSLSSFSLFLTNDEKTLFNTIKLNKILRISQKEQYKEFNCFDLVVNHIEDSAVLNKGNISVCAENKSEMNNWIEAVQAFKECQINVQNIDHNLKVVVDFEKINELLRTNPSGLYKGKNGVFNESNATTPYQQKKQLSNLFYENNSAITKSEAKVAREGLFKKQVSKILGFMRRSHIQRTQIQRKMVNEFKEAKKFSEQVHEKQELIKKMIEERIQNEQRKEESMIKLEQKSKELELLKAVTHKIESMKSQELKSYTKSLRKKIDSQKKKATEEASSMMKILINSEKLESYDTCTSPKLLLFQDTDYISSLCLRYYGENKQGECVKKENFCRMCCNHRIGIRYFKQLKDCKTKCDDLLEGINWQMIQKTSISKVTKNSYKRKSSSQTKKTASKLK